MVDKVTKAAVVGGVDTHKDLHVAEPPRVSWRVFYL